MNAAVNTHYAPGLTSEVPYQWQDDAACIGEDPEIFFPEPSASAAQALEVCASCPVIEQCKKLGANFEFGVWGGTTVKMRSDAKGPWRGSMDRQIELAKRGMPASEIARLCQVSERQVHRTLKAYRASGE